jgi:hypothetical protein
VLREERTARIERVVVPAPRASWRERLKSWMNETPPRPQTETLFEFSVGKYTFATQVATRWEFVRVPAAEFLRAAETQKVTPVLLMRNGYGKRWWWYLGRFYREAVGMTAGEVHEHVLRMLRAQEDEERRLLHLGTEEPEMMPAARGPAAREPDGDASSPSLEEDLKPSHRAPADAPSAAAVR